MLPALNQCSSWAGLAHGLWVEPQSAPLRGNFSPVNMLDEALGGGGYLTHVIHGCVTALVHIILFCSRHR